MTNEELQAAMETLVERIIPLEDQISQMAQIQSANSAQSNGPTLPAASDAHPKGICDDPQCDTCVAEVGSIYTAGRNSVFVGLHQAAVDLEMEQYADALAERFKAVERGEPLDGLVVDGLLVAG